MKNFEIFQNDYRNIFNTASEALILYDLETEKVVEVNPAACEMYGYSRSEFIGMHPTTFMQPESYQLFTDHMHTVQAGGWLEALVVHIRRDGVALYVEVRKSMVHYHNRPCLLSATRDVSQRIHTEKTLGEQIEARRREQATLLTISHTLGSTLELQPGLILEQLHEIVPYTHGTLFTLKNTELISLALRGNPKLEELHPLKITIDSPEMLEILFNGHRPTRIANVASDDPQAQFLRLLLTNSASVLLNGIQSWMWVPLAVRGRIIGALALTEITEDYFTHHHADLALSVANQAAITMINSELYGQAQALAVLEERQNLARSLHDAVNQSLFSAGLIAEVLPRLWERDQDEARHSLEDLRRLTRAAQAEMRTLLAELRPSTLTDSDLGDLLHLLGNAVSGRVNFPVTVTVSGEVNLPSEVQITFYRVCQEALNNVVKHANASQVQIELKRTETLIELRIRDNGQGFDFTQTFSGHYGLSMMHERAEAVGALLSVASKPGHGTELVLCWTIPSPVELVATVPQKNQAISVKVTKKTLQKDYLAKRAEDLI